MWSGFVPFAAANSSGGGSTVIASPARTGSISDYLLEALGSQSIRSRTWARTLNARASVTPRAADVLARRFPARSRRSARRLSNHPHARSLAVPCAATARGHHRARRGTRSTNASGNRPEKVASQSCRRRVGRRDVCAARADETPPAHRGELLTSASLEGPITFARVEVDVEDSYFVSRPGFHRVVPFALLLVPVLGVLW